jgi:hypothetical protein
LFGYFWSRVSGLFTGLLWTLISYLPSHITGIAEAHTAVPSFCCLRWGLSNC